jgi:energy-coupling factor transport system permease protein
VVLEYIPGKALFHRLDPRVKMLYFATVVLVVAWWSDPIFLSVVFGAIILILKMSRVPMGLVTSFLRALVPVIVAYFVFNLFLKPHENPHVLFYVIPPGVARFTLGVSVEAIVWSLAAVLRFLSILLTVRTVLLLTPVRDVVLSLVRMGLPPEFGVAMGIGFGYIPVLIDENRKIKEALQSRAWEFEYRNPFRRLKALMRMMVPTLMSTMRRANAIAVAIEAKGFSYNVRGRTWLKELRFSREDYAVMAVFVAVIVGAAVVGSPMMRIATYKFTSGLVLGLVRIP